MKLLQNIRVIDFSQFLSGPSAGLRLADFGAEVIKIERPGFGDICRRLYVSDVHIDGESTIFHAINRNKKSFVADLKDEEDFRKIEDLLVSADVMINNFRPGVIEKLGFGYERVKDINPQIIYAEISGYGTESSWRDRPGQDLLLQAMSGITYLSGDLHDDPTPMGVAVADIYSGTHLTQGILAALFRKNITGVGMKVSVSMLESLVDYQFEVLTTYYNDHQTLPVRSSVNNAHAYVAAPYGIYQTSDGYLALAMTSIPVLSRILECPSLAVFNEPAEWFEKRDEIKTILADHIRKGPTQYWLDRLEPEDIWCAQVLNYEQLISHEGYQCLQMEQLVHTSTGLELKTTRCPIRVDGSLLLSDRGAPLLGEHNSSIESLNTKKYDKKDH